MLAFMFWAGVYLLIASLVTGDAARWIDKDNKKIYSLTYDGIGPEDWAMAALIGLFWPVGVLLMIPIILARTVFNRGKGKDDE